MLTLLATISGPIMDYLPSQIPEPSDFAMFGLALAGLIIGRQSSKKRPNHTDRNA